MESESDPLTRRPVDLFEKEPLKGKWEVNLHTPTKFGEDPSKDLAVHREQTNKRCSNYSMIVKFVTFASDRVKHPIYGLEAMRDAGYGKQENAQSPIHKETGCFGTCVINLIENCCVLCSDRHTLDQCKVANSSWQWQLKTDKKL